MHFLTKLRHISNLVVRKRHLMYFINFIDSLSKSKRFNQLIFKFAIFVFLKTVLIDCLGWPSVVDELIWVVDEVCDLLSYWQHVVFPYVQDKVCLCWVFSNAL